jgi:hypothetical protein
MDSVFVTSFNALNENSSANDLCRSLQSAGINTFLPPSAINDETILRNEIKNLISKTNASVHIITNKYFNQLFSGKNSEEICFEEVEKYRELNPSYKSFIWSVASKNIEDIDTRQLAFISSIRNGLKENMTFSNVISIIQFVDDVRTSLNISETKIYDLKNLEVFFISNELDETESAEILDLLSDVVSAEHMQIVQDSDIDYSEFCYQQIGKSKLAVVYFKESADWALPFAQQIWKKLGGAASPVPILLIGDDDPDTNVNKQFKAPKVVSLVVSGILIPLEIKVNYDKAIGGKI